jgi:hypothetical protein
MVDARSTLKELMLSPEGTAAEPVEAGADEVAAADAGAVVDAGVLDDDEQPAATIATTAAAATSPTLGRDLDVPWLCERECHPP